MHYCKSLWKMGLAIMLIIALGMMSVGCVTTESGSGTGTLTIATDFDQTSLDPAVTYDNSSRVIILLYENLVTLKGATSEIVPQLAKEWDVSDNGKVYTFYLREGVKFHDGAELTAEAVKLSLERLVRINKGPAWMFEDIKSIDVVGPLTVKITLIHPDTSFLAKLAGPAGPQIISPKAIREHSENDGQDWFYDHEAGTGPYKLETWEHGQKVVLTKYDEYWGGWDGNHIDKVVFTYIKEGSTQKLMLEKGDIDIAYGLSNEQLEAVKDSPGVKIASSPTQNIVYMAMNTQKGPLQDEKVRQAISYALDYDAVINGIYNGNYKPLYGPLPETDLNHLNPEEFPYKYDLNKARELLAESSYPDGGFTLQMYLFEGTDDWRRISELVQQNLAELNITVEIQEMSNASLLDMAGQLGTAPDLVVIGNYPDYADSTAMLGNQYLTKAMGSNGWNFSYYSNPAVDELFAEVLGTTSQSERAEKIHEIEELIVADAPVVFVATRVGRIAMRENVQGFVFRPMMSNSFPVYSMWKSE